MKNTFTVYKLYDDRDSLIYVGCTGQGAGRLRQLESLKEWWPLVRAARLEHYSDVRTASEREASLIASEHPPYNAIPGSYPKTKKPPARETPLDAQAPHRLTVEEAADYLKVSRYTISKWLREGKLKGTQIGGRKAGWRIPQAEIRRLLGEGKEDRE